MTSVRLQGKSFNITVIQVYAPTSNAEEAEQFHEDLQDLPELTPPKDVLFIIGDWIAKVENQEIPGATGKFGLGVQNEAGQRLKEWERQEISSTKLEISGNISCKDGLNKGQKWYGPNRSRRYEEDVARIHGRTVQKRSSRPIITMV